MEEFYQQGEKELTLGLPLTTFPNRKNFDYIFARHQNGFLVNVVRPLFDVFTSLCDFDTRESVIASAAENGDAWTRRENAHRPREKGPGGEDASKEGKDGARGKIGSTHPVRKPGALARQSTMGWVQEFKQSNLTMLTANAMEMKGLHLTLDFEYGADDECASAVRSLVPYVSRGELARLGRQGLLEADPEEAHSPPSDKSVLSSKTFAAKLAATETFDAAVVVATFDGFLDLERRAGAREQEGGEQEGGPREAGGEQPESGGGVWRRAQRHARQSRRLGARERRRRRAHGSRRHRVRLPAQRRRRRRGGGVERGKSRGEQKTLRARSRSRSEGRSVGRRFVPASLKDEGDFRTGRRRASRRAVRVHARLAALLGGA
jgi:hypothetical protein